MDADPHRAHGPAQGSERWLQLEPTRERLLIPVPGRCSEILGQLGSNEGIGVFQGLPVIPTCSPS